MTSSRPYMIRAIYDWLLDNELTPHLLVNTLDPEISVPADYVEDGKIVLNIEPNAVLDLELENDAITFKARFSGISHDLYVPVRCVKAIYAFENGRGMVFEDGDDDNGGEGKKMMPSRTPPSRAAGNKKKPSGRPHLKIVK